MTSPRRWGTGSIQRMAVQVAVVLGLAGTCALVPASAASSAARAAACTPWVTQSSIHPEDLWGTPDTSVSLGLQAHRCTFGSDLVWRYRATLTNHYASGKTDVAVGLKHNDVGGVGHVDGVWHPLVASGSTWASPEYGMPSGVRVWADTHISYRARDMYGATPAVTAPGP